MRYYETRNLERIGYDFYCDIAEQITKAREIKGWTQKRLAEELNWKVNRLSRIELVQIRTKLDDIEKLAKALGVSVDWLICAEIDCQVGECLYTVWATDMKDFKLYSYATSKRMAYLKLEQRLNKSGVRFLGARGRAAVRLVGIPVTDDEIKAKFPRKVDGDEEILPDRDGEADAGKKG